MKYQKVYDRWKGIWIFKIAKKDVRAALYMENKTTDENSMAKKAMRIGADFGSSSVPEIKLACAHGYKYFMLTK